MQERRRNNNAGAWGVEGKEFSSPSSIQTGSIWFGEALHFIQLLEYFEIVLKNKELVK